VSHTPSILEQMRGDRIYSPVFKYKGQKLKFKLLSQFERSFARTAAQRATWRSMTEIFDKEDPELVRDLMKFHAPSQDAWQDWDDCYILAATLVTETGGALYPQAENDHVVAEEIARSFTPLERADLHARYLDFHDDHDPEQYTDDEIISILDEVKKNSRSGPGLAALLWLWCSEEITAFYSGRFGGIGNQERGHAGRVGSSEISEGQIIAWYTARIVTQKEGAELRLILGLDKPSLTLT